MKRGWIKMYRKIEDHPMYFEERFTRMGAWMDLLLLAEPKGRTIRIRGVNVEVKRGQIAESKETLSKRWKWYKKGVDRFLKELENDGMIAQQKSNVITCITILSYELYQESSPTGSPTNSPTKNSKNSPTNSPTKNTENEVVTSVIEQKMQESSPTDSPPKNSESSPTLKKYKEVKEYKKKNNPKGLSKKQQPEIDFDGVMELYHETCRSYPQLLKLSEARKAKIKIRLEEMNGDMEMLKRVFEKAEASKFLRGDNKRGWKATFDWLFSNSTNWIKIYEGNYDNQGNQTRHEASRTDSAASAKEQRDREFAEYIANKLANAKKPNH